MCLIPALNGHKGWTSEPDRESKGVFARDNVIPAETEGQVVRSQEKKKRMQGLSRSGVNKEFEALPHQDSGVLFPPL